MVWGMRRKLLMPCNLLRDRVGMPPVDFDREYNQEADYGFRNLDKYIQAVRRERRVAKKPVKDAVRKISCAGLLRTN